MKLKKIHLFVIILGVLILSSLGIHIKESFSSGIKKQDIPEGDEDLYVKKTEIVPPVCPKCPDSRSCPRPKPCPPCAPCARCPEPAFECKRFQIIQQRPIVCCQQKVMGMKPNNVGGVFSRWARTIPRLSSFANFNFNFIYFIIKLTSFFYFFYPCEMFSYDCFVVLSLNTILLFFHKMVQYNLFLFTCFIFFIFIIFFFISFFVQRERKFSYLSLTSQKT